MVNAGDQDYPESDEFADYHDKTYGSSLITISDVQELYKIRI